MHAESIVLARVEATQPSTTAAEDFGRSLAATHGSGAAAFGAGPPGWTGDGFIGRQVLALEPQPTWGSFYASTRLMPYAEAAHQIGNLSDSALTAVHRVCTRLQAGEFDDDRPAARIHGDLWGGNVIYADTGVVLIDPAAHGGHGQTDLAMLSLFGLPLLDRVEAAYAEAAGLPADWRDRTDLHQLHPLLVHAVTHGPSYGAEAARAAARYA